MVSYGHMLEMGNKKSTCLYLDQEVVETVEKFGLNVSRVSENALFDAIRRLVKSEQATSVQGPINIEGRGRDSNPGARLHRPSNIDVLLQEFYGFCKVDLGLTEVTAEEYRRKMRRFLKAVGKPATKVTAEDVRGYLRPLSGGSPNSYGNALKPLKKFFRDFMKMGETVGSFKFRKMALRPVVVPTNEELQRFYQALQTPRARALFLMYASTGLRRNELLTLRKDDMDWEKRMVIPGNHSGETKKSWVTFFNEEAERVLKEYLATRDDENHKLFRISPHTFIRIWKEGYNKTGVRITPQILRKWFCDELGNLGAPDRCVDAFCGRVPKSVLARRYTDFALDKLQRIYAKADLRIC